MKETPSTSVVEHWVAWTYTEDAPEEYIEHDTERLNLFRGWYIEQVRAERNRIIDILDVQTKHYAKTHCAGRTCNICEIYRMIESGYVQDT
jgi:hypothetical protein